MNKLIKKNGKVFIRSGAGIVADSVPKKEYEECLNKAKAVKMAIQGAEGFVYCVSSLWVLPLSSWWKNSVRRGQGLALLYIAGLLR